MVLGTLAMMSILAAPPALPARYQALGDSYTIGESVPAAARWPNRLAELLRTDGIAIANPEIIARTGWTTDELSAALDAVEHSEQVAMADGEFAPKPAPPYALVSLLIGVNNQYRGRSVDEYRRELRVLIERAVGYAGGKPERVIVLSIPDWGVTPFGQGCGRDTLRISAEIDAFNAVNREIADANGVFWLDITGLTREFGARPDMLAGDGLHPSGAMYALWVERLMDSLP